MAEEPNNRILDQTLGKEVLKCAVVTCPHIHIPLVSENKTPNFFNFPKSSKNCSIWRENCGLAPGADVTNLVVCSNHFSDEDFKKTNPKLCLNDDAIPSKNLEIEPLYMVISSAECPLQSDVEKAVDENISLQKQLKYAQSEQITLIQNTNRMYSKFNKRLKIINKIQRRHDRLRNIPKQENFLKNVFSDTQINVLRGKRTVWTDDDLAMAFTLRQMGSKECYLHLKNTLNMPLPGLGAVQKWCAQYNDE